MLYFDIHMGETKVLVTAEQLLEMAGDRRLELVRGEVVQMAPVGLDHIRIVGLLISWIVPFVRERQLGVAGPELGCVLARQPDLVRAPDIAFVSKARFSKQAGAKFFEGAADLAVEVVSPSDKASEMQQKIDEYLAAGTRLVWLVDPQSQTVTAYHPSGDAHLYRGNEPVPGEDVLPGFSFRPSDLFRLE